MQPKNTYVWQKGEPQGLNIVPFHSSMLMIKQLRIQWIRKWLLSFKI